MHPYVDVLRRAGFLPFGQGVYRSNALSATVAVEPYVLGDGSTVWEWHATTYGGYRRETAGRNVRSLERFIANRARKAMASVFGGERRARGRS